MEQEEKLEISEEKNFNKKYWNGDKLIVETRDGKKYIFEEQLGEMIEKASEVATLTKKDRQGNITKELKENIFFNTLICRSCIEPKLDESKFDMVKLKASEMMILKSAILDLYDIQSFLK